MKPESQYPPASSHVTNTAVSALSLGLASSASSTCCTYASKRSILEEDGWPSSNPSGLPKETDGRVLPWMSASRSTVSLICAARCAGLPMIDVAYWKGLQIWQY